MSRTVRNGFTLVELLVCIFIAVILVGLLVPATRRVREPAERTLCANNLKQIILGLHNYHDTYGHFPSGCDGKGSTPEERISWTVSILPYVEQPAVYKQFDFGNGYAGNQQPARLRMKIFECPSTQGPGEAEPRTDYVAMSGIGLDAATRPKDATGNGFMGYDRLTTLDMIKDGAANTVALMERRSDFGPWAQGGPATVLGFDADAPLSGNQPTAGGHSGGTLSAMADGSVRSIPHSVKAANLAAAITIAGGEPVNLD